jgi:hypothetical protein
MSWGGKCWSGITAAVLVSPNWFHWCCRIQTTTWPVGCYLLHLALAEIVDMLQPGQINNQQVEAAFSAFASILAAADARRKQRNTVRQGHSEGGGGQWASTQYIISLMLAGCVHVCAPVMYKVCKLTSPWSSFPLSV